MCSVYGISFSFLAHIPLRISRGEKKNLLEYINFFFSSKDYSYCHLPNLPQLCPLNPSALLTPGTLPAFPDAGARPCNPQEACISSRRHLELKDELAGTCSPCPSAQAAPAELPYPHAWRTAVCGPNRGPQGPSARPSWRLRPSWSGGHSLPVTVAVPLSVHLERDN